MKTVAFCYLLLLSLKELDIFVNSLVNLKRQLKTFQLQFGWQDQWLHTGVHKTLPIQQFPKSKRKFIDYHQVWPCRFFQFSQSYFGALHIKTLFCNLNESLLHSYSYSRPYYSSFPDQFILELTETSKVRVNKLLELLTIF